MSRRKKKIELRNRTTDYLKCREWNIVNNAVNYRIMPAHESEKLSDIVKELLDENNFEDEENRDEDLYEALKICQYHSSYDIGHAYNS